MNVSIEGCECYVAFIDILGFKKLVLNHNIEYISNIFERILQFRTESIKEEVIADSTFCDFNEMVRNTFMRIMSDSVVIATPMHFRDSLPFVVDCCQNLQAILLKDNILARGAISTGEFCGKDEIMFGKGLVNAYSMESSDAKHPRILLSKKMVNDYDAKWSTRGVILITDYIVKDDDEYYFVNYLNIAIIKLKINPQSITDNINTNLSDPSISGNTREKYLWMKNYFNKAIDYRGIYKVRIEQSLRIDEDITRDA